MFKKNKSTDVFKRTKKQPIDIRGYEFVGFHEDYKNIAYYVQKLQHNNYNLLEAKLDVLNKKFVLTAGTSIKVLDSFMYYYLKRIMENPSYSDSEEFKTFVKDAVEDSFATVDEETRNSLTELYNCKVPQDVKIHDEYKKAVKEGFKVLYCSNDESDKKKFGIVHLTMYKEQEIDGFHIKRHYTVFRPLTYMVKPSYLKKEGVVKYNEMALPDLAISHDILNKKD